MNYSNSQTDDSTDPVRFVNPLLVVDGQKCLIRPRNLDESGRRIVLNGLGFRVKSIGMMLRDEPAVRRNDGLARHLSLHPQNTEQFPLVVALGVIPWLHSPTKALSEMARVLERGGYLVVNADKLYTSTQATIEYLRNSRPAIRRLFLLGTPSLGEEIEAAGFTLTGDDPADMPEAVVIGFDTTLIFSPDHGRGKAPHKWKSHGAKIPDSKYIWMAFLGPDTQALGERSNVPAVTQNQIAATLAAFAVAAA